MINTSKEKSSAYYNNCELSKKFPQKPAYDFVKRVFDIFLSIMALMVLAIPMVVIAIIIKLDSPGEVIYKQKRLAKNGVNFTLYKFRTMYIDAEKNGAKWADKHDSRVTKVGYWLRLFRLDEIPQFVNILKGEISIVGPRPEREIFHNEFKERIAGWEKRLLVKPGLTGLAQVSGGYDLDPEKKIIFDLEYVEKRSILLDIKILFKTVVVVFSHNGAR